MSPGPDLVLALALADAADAITLSRFRATDLRVETKPDLTPVTEADRAVERELRRLLAERRPGRGIVGEEQGESGGEARPPLDHRSDRRDQELRARHPALRDPDRARGPRRRRVGACARPALVGRARARRVQRGPGASRSHGWHASRTPS